MKRLHRSVSIRILYSVFLVLSGLVLPTVVPNQPAQAAQNIPVYRLANYITHERLFTTSTTEVSHAVSAYPGWVSEGVAFYSVSSNYTGAKPVYRLANWITHERLFTTSQAEVTNAIAAYPGWVSEGTGFYSVPSGDSSAIAVYRLANWETHERLFTTSAGERDNAVANLPGWVSEGTGFYAVPSSNSSVPGQSYLICDTPSQLTSPWTYHALASGQQTYTVAQYEALAGYGTTLPPLPSYIAAEPAGTTAAVIFAPGATVNLPAYAFPELPLLYFFEGGNYGPLALDTLSGDQFIGGSTTGFGEPVFDNGGNADGINGQNGSHYFSGGASTLSAQANVNDTSITTSSPIPGYINYVTLADGTTYHINNVVGNTISIDNHVTATNAAGSKVWAAQDQPLAYVSAGAAQGATSLTLGASTMPLVQYGRINIGDDSTEMTSVSGSQSGYTVGVAGLDSAVSAHTPIYYSDLSGGVTVSYLNINNDQHQTTGTIYTGAGWTVTHNNIHDGNSKGPGYGVAIYGGDEGTVEYNCLDKMGDYGINVFGSNSKFDYNEVRDSNYQPDPGCGCSGGGKWWGTLNADIVANAFVDDSPGGGIPVWLDNGNSGTNIQDNFFERSYGAAISAETGFNLNVTGNLFQNGGWADGTGPGDSNSVGAVTLNSTGGFHVPGSRYDKQVNITSNQFVNNWGGIGVWQSGGRSCENSGEGWPYDAPYCSGGFPNTQSTAAPNQYYFSHYADSSNGGSYTTVSQAASAGASTVMLNSSQATSDYIGFADPSKTTTASTTNVIGLTGTQIVKAASLAGFPSAGQLRVGTSAAWDDGNGSWTGAILSYTGTSSNTVTCSGASACFTGVSNVRGKGTLSGPVWGVQQYKVNSETCYANQCAVSITPALTGSITAGTDVTNAGTCQLYATSAATPVSPLAPDGTTSYYDGCQWGTAGISVSNNEFDFDAAAINADQPINGGTNTCNASNYCGTNFMSFQEAGEAPFDSFIGGNAMMSNSNLASCPSWDPGCTTSPLKNINSLTNPPSAPANNGEASENNVWSNNTYNGAWTWNVYWYGTCGQLPSDTSTGHAMPAPGCQESFSQWQSNWQQDAGSTYTP